MCMRSLLREYSTIRDRNGGRRKSAEEAGVHIQVGVFEYLWIVAVDVMLSRLSIVSLLRGQSLNSREMPPPST